MMFRSLLPFVLVTAPISGLAAQVPAETSPVVAEPVTVWEADYAERDCGLKRHFQLEQGIVSLDIRQNAPNNAFRVTVFAEKLERKGRKAQTSFADDAPLEHENFLNLKSGEWEGIELGLSPDYFDSATDSGVGTLFSIHQAFDRDLTLRLDQLDSALAAMDQCLDDLLTEWGFDPLEYRSFTRHLSSDDAEWFSSGLMPILRSSYAKDGSEIDVFLRVGPDGRVSECTIFGEAGQSGPGKRACKNLKRLGRFEPALDADGNPTSSFAINSWRSRRVNTIQVVP